MGVKMKWLRGETHTTSYWSVSMTCRQHVGAFGVLPSRACACGLLCAWLQIRQRQAHPQAQLAADPAGRTPPRHRGGAARAAHLDRRVGAPARPQQK